MRTGFSMESRGTFYSEGRVGNRLPLADGTAARAFKPVPLPEHEPAPPALGRNLGQSPSLCVETFPKVFQVMFDLLFLYSDGEGDFFRAMRTLLQEGADPASYRFLLLEGIGHGPMAVRDTNP